MQISSNFKGKFVRTKCSDTPKYTLLTCTFANCLLQKNVKFLNFLYLGHSTIHATFHQ